MSRIKGLFIACAVLSFLGLSLLLILQSWPQSDPLGDGLPEGSTAGPEG